MTNGYSGWQKAELGYDPTPTPITWAEAKPLLQAGKIVLVDARPKAAYDAGHIPGALSLPELASAQEYKDLQTKYGPDTHIVVYCSDLKCAASVRSAIKLATWYNFRKVQFMKGGYVEYQQEAVASQKVPQ
jgi:rhodanese-related sulfurtransferase